MSGRRPHKASMAQIRALATGGEDPFPEKGRDDGEDRIHTLHIGVGDKGDIAITVPGARDMMFSPQQAADFASAIMRAALLGAIKAGIAIEMMR